MQPLKTINMNQSIDMKVLKFGNRTLNEKLNNINSFDNSSKNYELNRAHDSLFGGKIKKEMSPDQTYMFRES